MCVSAKVAEQMALNVCKLFGSDVGIGITGFASTQHEKGVNDLYAYLAIAENGNILLSEKIRSEKKESHVVQAYYTEQLLQRLAELAGKTAEQRTQIA
jgi:nicotinamide mononucleotide (NMN) deamidase PncC